MSVAMADPDGVSVAIPGRPVAQGRPRGTARGGFVRFYDPKQSKAWKESAAVWMRQAMRGRALLDGPLAVGMLIVFPCPKSDYRKRAPMPRRWHISKPDVDNVVKIVLDAANLSIWLDDSQVCRFDWIEAVIGAQDEMARVELTVCPITEGP